MGAWNFAKRKSNKSQDELAAEFLRMIRAKFVNGRLIAMRIEPKPKRSAKPKFRVIKTLAPNCKANVL